MYKVKLTPIKKSLIDESHKAKEKSTTKKNKAAYKTLIETFNQHKLNHIIQNEEFYKKYMRPECFEDESYNPFTLAKKYFNKSVDGKITVNYIQKESKGRFCALGSLSMQTLPREIRHTIADGYTDIDMVNAHPVILLHLCKQRNIRTPYLKEYIKNRDNILETLDKDKAVAKEIIISLINGGNKAFNNIKVKTEWIESFKKEMGVIHKSFSMDKAFKKYKKETNKEASYMNSQLCDFENNILMVVYEALGSPKDCVLCFDGLMVKTENWNGDLIALSEAVYDTLNIKVEFKTKAMDQALYINEDELKLYEKPLPFNCFNFDDAYSYVSFQNEFKEKSYDSWDDMNEEIKTIYPKVINRILHGEGSYIKKGVNGVISIVKTLGISNFTVYIAGKPKKFTEYLAMQDGLGNYICDLESKTTKDFNLWSGFQAKETDKPENEGFELMKKFIYEVWASSNEDHYNYIISWIAGLVTNLKGINMVALVMIAGQGTGKGFLLQFLRYILRDTNTCEVAGVDSITQKHNAILQNKRLVCINEMSSAKDEFKKNFDRMKNFITDPKISIEPKNVDAFNINNISNFLLFTNHRDAVIVEKTDRRYALFEMSDIHINDQAYFTNMADKCFNQETADLFYTYLLNFPAVSLKNIPQTILRTEAQELSKSSPVSFIDYCIEEKLFEDDPVILASELYIKYTSWCQANGERVFINKKFSMAISTMIRKKRIGGGMAYDFR